MDENQDKKLTGTSQSSTQTQKKPVLAEQANPDIVNKLVSQTQKKTPPAPKKPAGGTQKNAPQKSTNNKTARPQTQGKTQRKPVNKTNTASGKAQTKQVATETKSTPKTTTKKPMPTRKTSPAKRNPARPTTNRKQNNSNSVLKIIPLGGLGEIGKNITYYECNGDALLVDCGMAFPDESMPGIDIVIPDFTYLVENQKKIRGLVVTHGHEDHIGSIPYLLKHFNIPIYGTRLTLGLVEGKLKEHGLLREAKLNVVKPGDTVRLGCMSAEFIKVNHSIPDACSIALHTPAGIVIQTGDFKIDFTPIDGEMINLARFGELGSKGVLALLSDSTNAEKPGSTKSEKIVGASLENLFNHAQDKRIIIATFASNVHRIQQIIDVAVKTDRKVAVSGRSMENVSAKALELGYLQVPDGVLIDIDECSKYPMEKVVIITTGSQGEPMSALTRMARGDHRKVSVTPNDCIILSATPIPGNEILVTKVVNSLMLLGAQVVYDKMYDIHVSGHACQDELKMMLALTKPKYFIPVHGEYKHLKIHAGLAMSMGIAEENIHIGNIGQVIEFGPKGMKQTETVQAGKVMVDGLGIGDVGSIVLRDRKHLAEDGLIVVLATIQRGTGKILAGPDIVSRGFVYVRESEDMIGKAKSIARKSIESSIKTGKREWSTLKTQVRDDVGDYVWQTTKRSPMILPVIQEVS